MIISAPLGATLRIVKSFRDFDGAEHAAGTELKLIKRDFFPYDGRYTFTFEGGRVVRLSENVPENDAVLAAPAGVYFEIRP